MKRYKNYIFDLYGTLVDILTDEEDPGLWKWLAAFYSCYGAKWDPAELKARYHSMVKEQEARLSERFGWQYPEIKIEDVFRDLLTEKRANALAVSGPLGFTDERTFEFAVACGFRVRSRIKLEAYSGAAGVLRKLKEEGATVHLLSNAQLVFTLPELYECGLADLFDSVYISSDKGMKKPQKEFMELLLKEQGLDVKDCVMVGNDFSTDVAVAQAVGMDAIFINSFGYDKDRIDKENTCGAAVVRDITQIL